MTKEELKLEAIRYLENFKDCANCKNRWGDCADQLDEYCLINGCCFATPKEQDIYLAGAEPREKRIAELEKENAELKSDNTEWERASDKWKSVYELTNNQLTKAKEIIRSLYFIIQGRIDYKGNIPLEDEMYRANQFLNGEVEK